jgi:phage shock protein A
MTDVNMQEKYLAQMLEGAEQGLNQMETALSQIEAQRENIQKRRDELKTVVIDLRKILGLGDEPSFWKEDNTL